MARALEPSLPVAIQATLLTKAAAYDRTLPALRSRRVVVVIVVRDDDPESVRVGRQLRAELSAYKEIVGMPHQEILISWTDAAALGRICREQEASILYVAPGFESDVPRIAEAFVGTPILTSGAMANYAERGLVLSFDLISGHAKLLVHLGQARRQGVNLNPDMIHLAKVFR